jgi:hypothetical protein
MSPNFIKNNSDMLEAAERAIELRQHLPALVLIYSHIDTLAWAGSAKEKQSNRRTFEAWVSQWLLPELQVDAPTLTAADLYGARCGILHSLTSKSDLSSSGAAKQIAYAWGSADPQLLDQIFAATQFAGAIVTLHYQALLNALKRAYANFLSSTSADPSLVSRLEVAAGHHYMNIPMGARDGG